MINKYFLLNMSSTRISLQIRTACFGLYSCLYTLEYEPAGCSGTLIEFVYAWINWNGKKLKDMERKKVNNSFNQIKYNTF